VSTLRVRLHGLLRRANRPPRVRIACLYLGAGVLTVRQLHEVSVVRWEAYAAGEFTEHAGLEEWEQRVYREVLRSDDRVLLVGCGTGRDLIGLIRLGYDVVGLEQSAVLADEARAQLRQLGLASAVIAESAESYPMDAPYDAVVFSLYMYSYIIGTASRVAVLTRARKALLPQGRVIISYATVQRQSPVWIFLARLGSVCSASDWWPERGDRLQGPVSQADVLNLEHQFSPDEIAGECRAAGLRVIRDESINALFRVAVAVV
jgi:protein-L-isoaspartate O-methyltransferase